MNTTLGGKIVAGWARTAFSMPAFQVHHVEYPQSGEHPWNASEVS